MQSLVNILEGIGSAVVAVINFVITLFQDLIFCIQSVAMVLGHLPAYFSWLPGEVVALLLVLLSVVAIYKILGREG